VAIVVNVWTIIAFFLPKVSQWIPATSEPSKKPKEPAETMYVLRISFSQTRLNCVTAYKEFLYVSFSINIKT